MKMIEKKFDAVKFMREQRDKSSLKLYKMTNAEIVAYFNKKKKTASVKPSA